MQPRKLVVVFGGRSAEHEISLRSADQVISAARAAGMQVQCLGIQRDGSFVIGNGEESSASAVMQSGRAPEHLVTWLQQADVVFPILHGPFGEDGSFQGFLDTLGLPYVGSDVLASAVCMDKAVLKELLSHPRYKLPVVPWLQFHRYDTQDLPSFANDVAREIGFPCFVKPANQGSSIGVHRVSEAANLLAALQDALRYDDKLIVEKGLVRPREIEVAVLGNGDSQTIVSAPGEIALPGDLWYDYDNKYVSDQSTSTVPADLPAPLIATLQQLARTAFRIAGCKGLARVDFLVDRASLAIYLNEINTLPGFTSISMYPKMMAHAGVSIGELIERLCDLAVEQARHRHTRALHRT